MTWITTVSRAQATGELADVYARLGRLPMPPAYRPDHGDAPGIIRAHSLDPGLLLRTFSVSACLRDDAMSWARRELVNVTAARANECFY
jgi:uncharacterized peroxidase-related enzyme